MYPKELVINYLLFTLIVTLVNEIIGCPITEDAGPTSSGAESKFLTFQYNFKTVCKYVFPYKIEEK